jgi:hypothetical protein
MTGLACNLKHQTVRNPSGGCSDSEPAFTQYYARVGKV